MNLLGGYKNGNYNVHIYNDGTKIRETDEDVFISSFPECIDIKITNQCDMNCPYCHENSTSTGLHGELLNNQFVDTLQPYTELAIGGGNPLSHPQLVEFLELLKNKNIIANITVNQNHFMQNTVLIDNLISANLIKGLGVSFTHYDEQFIKLIKEYPNAVLHVINGIVNYRDLERMYNKNLKLLILGYKHIRRGIDYYSQQVEDKKKLIYDNIRKIINGFKVVSFDNLAIKQLELKRIFTHMDWNEFYMGDDGQFTMYIDMVNHEFARSSTSSRRYKITNSIFDMFKVVKSENTIKG